MMGKKAKPDPGPPQADSDTAAFDDVTGKAVDRPTPASDDGVSSDQIEVSDEAAEMIRQLQADLDEAVEGRKRALADFRNFQRRALENEHRAAQSGITRVVKSILPALDHFDLALTQDVERMTMQQLLDAVRIVRDEFTKALAAQGVERIVPDRGEPFDPNRHEAVMRQAAKDLPPNSVVITMQAGYALGDLVLRPAKVAVSPGND